MPKNTPNTEADFWARVRKTDGCWLWIGATDIDGYGRMSWNGKTTRAHVISYQLHHGAIGDLFVCHHCDTPACVHPNHLFLGTNRDNLRDRDTKGRHAESRKTHCPSDHEYTPDNTRMDKNGKRHCRACERNRRAVAQTS